MKRWLLLLALPALAHADDRGGPRKRPEPPSVSLGKPTVTGKLALDLVRRYIYRNKVRFSYCYERVLHKKPGLAGRIDTSFEIDGAGKVTAATASGVDPEISECFAGVIKRIEFPKPRDEKPVAVKFPLVLRP
jgi:hypothetical protein